ncbi:MAG TPA: substrate-binding domain-containing protein, partial [Gemmata sp.]|nr:substrate-binding domain-containing protein [Gemmata sp.]
ERDAMEQIRIVDRRVATWADGIVLAPQHSRTMTACVKRAAESGIPVVVIDSGLADPDHYVKYVATDNYNGGRLAAEHLFNELKKIGKEERPRLVLFRYAVGSESTEQREQGFLDRMHELCPAAEWVSTDKYAGATRDSASREAKPLVNALRDRMDAIFAPNESSATGMLDVLRSQGLNKKVLLMAFDASKPLLESIREGDICGSVLQDPYKMGYLSTYCCVRYIQGYDVNAGRTEMSLGTGEHVVVLKDGRFNTTKNEGTDFVLGLYDPAMQAKRLMNRPVFPRRVSR